MIMVEVTKIWWDGERLMAEPVDSAIMYKDDEAAQPEFPMHEEGEDGWSDFVCPDPKSYLMKCCDCGLVHEAQFKVVRYKSEAEREDCEPVDDPNLQAVFRMRRSEQWTPKDTAYRPGGLAQPEQEPTGKQHLQVEQPEQEPVALPEKIYEFVPTPEPAKWHHPDCEGECIACLIEREVTAVYGTLGLAYLRRHLAVTQPPEQEPVAWFEHNPDLDAWFLAYSKNQNPGIKSRPLVFGDTAPPQRQPLTDEEISDIWCKVSNTDFVTADTHEFARAIEAAHGIKECP